MVLDSFKRLPTGAGGRELAEVEQVPVESVVNKVIYVNPAFDKKIPFKIKQGKPTELAVFATKLSSQETPDEQRSAEGAFKHRRSLVVAHVIFKDAEGRLYRDVDAKGIGHIVPIKGRLKTFQISWGGHSQGMKGIFERQMAISDAAMAETFISLGIRTYRVIAITELKELINSGDKLSIEAARRVGLIEENSHPVVSIRAFGIRDRIDDIDSEIPLPFRKSIEDARLMVAQELGKDPQEFGDKEYFHWFVETLAGNVARMHKGRLVHGYLSPHNITLDCRVVDLDSVHPGPELSVGDIMQNLTWRQNDYEEGHHPYNNDLFSARSSLAFLGSTLQSNNAGIASGFEERFNNKYFQTFRELTDSSYVIKQSG